MSKFARSLKIARPSGPTSSNGPARTHERGRGFALDDKSALYTLAVTNLVGEATFYEAGAKRDERFAALVASVTATDPAWMQSFIPWLRTAGFVRSASLVAAAEYAAAGGPDARRVISSACARADEPAELLAYWLAQHGRRIPAVVKRGVADATTRLYDARTALKYDSSRAALRPGDVIELTHARPRDVAQSQVFRHLIDRRHGRDSFDLSANAELVEAYAFDAVPESDRHEYLAANGLPRLYTWERLSSWLPGGMDALAWESLVPQLGYMALLRNLRNIEQAGVGAETVATVNRRLADPVEVARSRQFPMRFLSAWEAAGSMTFAAALEAAVEHATSNVPVLRGRTLVMLDVSGSMESPLSARSTIARWKAGAVFAGALAKRSDCDIVPYGTVPKEGVREVRSVLRFAEDIHRIVGGGTNTWQCVEASYKGHDRVVILTDEQSHDSATRNLPVPIYVWNLAGYGVSTVDPGRGRYVLGGLSDASFNLIPLLERGADAGWPWETPSAA